MAYAYGLSCEDCQYHFKYSDGLQGTFASPGYPEEYPQQVTCCYVFDAVNNGGVQIKFDTFNLEGKSESEKTCLYDYIDVYTMDKQGYKTVMGRYCGSDVPGTITSPQSRLLIEFVSDYTKPSTGFHGRYSFLDDNWQPFDHDGSLCGHGIREGSGGVIESPNYPKPFEPRYTCSWLIKVRDDEQILLVVDDLDIGTSSHCAGGSASLQIYDGYATNNTMPKEKLCGQMHSVASLRRIQSTSTASRVVIRFIAGMENNAQSRGFRLIWTAVQLPAQGSGCPEFQCEGGRYCVEGVICDRLPKYCIHDDLRCDGITNCGQHDDSDERRCPRELLIMTALIAIPSLAVVSLVVVVIYCYRTKRVKKSTSQDQPLTSGHRHGSSNQSFNSHRSYQQCMMHTSFIDGGAGAAPGGNGACSSGSGAAAGGVGGAGPVAGAAGVGGRLPGMEEMPLPGIIDDQQLQIPIPKPPDPNYRTHQKRASYHMMKENFEDGNMIIAEI
nr:hypothetical protein BaRGS_001346 [Batillaria attramentaria]